LRAWNGDTLDKRIADKKAAQPPQNILAQSSQRRPPVEKNKWHPLSRTKSACTQVVLANVFGFVKQPTKFDITAGKTAR